MNRRKDLREVLRSFEIFDSHRRLYSLYEVFEDFSRTDFDDPLTCQFGKFLDRLSQRTGRTACWTSNDLTRSEFQLASASTLVTTPTFNGCTGISLNSCS